MAAVAQLKAVLGMDSKEFKAGMKSATKDASTFQSNIKKVGAVIAGAFTVSAIVGFGKSLVGWASTVSEAAQNAGILTSEMMALNEAGLKGGIGVDETRSMLSVLQTELASAADGTETSRKKFEALGLDIVNLSGMNPAQMFEEVAKAAVATGAPLEALAEIFGTKLGPKAVSMIRSIADDGLSIVASDAAKAADAVEDLGDRWAAAVEKMKRKAIALALPVMDFIESEAVRAKAERKAFKESSFMERMGFEGTRKARAAGEEAVQKWWQDKYAEDQKREADKKAEMQAAADARKARALVGQKVVTGRVEEDMAKLEEDRKQKRRAGIDKWQADRMKRYDIRKGGEERQARLQEQLTSLTNPQAGASTMNPDAMARIGGFFGGERAGFDVQSKQLEVQRESKKILDEIARNTAETKEALARSRGEI